jgi:hypothetical protein
MDRPLSETNEVPLWVMVFPFEALRESLKTGKEDNLEILAFLYDFVFPSAYDPGDPSGYARETGIPGYRPYVKGVKERTLAKLVGKHLRLSKTADLLLPFEALICEYKSEIVGLNLLL